KVSLSHVHAVLSAPMTMLKLSLMVVQYASQASRTVVLIISHTRAKMSESSCHFSPIHVNVGDRTFSQIHVMPSERPSHAGLMIFSHAALMPHDSACHARSSGVRITVLMTARVTLATFQMPSKTFLMKSPVSITASRTLNRKLTNPESSSRPNGIPEKSPLNKISVMPVIRTGIPVSTSRTVRMPLTKALSSSQPKASRSAPVKSPSRN